MTWAGCGSLNQPSSQIWNKQGTRDFLANVSILPVPLENSKYTSWVEVKIKTDRQTELYTLLVIKRLIDRYTRDTKGKCLKYCMMIILSEENGTTSSSLHSLMINENIQNDTI